MSRRQRGRLCDGGLADRQHPVSGACFLFVPRIYGCHSRPHSGVGGREFSPASLVSGSRSRPRVCRHHVLQRDGVEPRPVPDELGGRQSPPTLQTALLQQRSWEPLGAEPGGGSDRLDLLGGGGQGLAPVRGVGGEAWPA